MNTAHQYGVVGTVQAAYLGWSGRFSTFGTLSAVLLSGLHGASPFLALVLAIWWLALWRVMSGIARLRQWVNPASYSAIGASLVFLTLLNSAFNIMQSTYWLSGIMGYLLTLVLLTVYIGLILTFPTRRCPAERLVILVLCGAITFIAAGYGELFGTVETLGLLVAYVTCVFWSPIRPLRQSLLAGLLGSIFGLLIVVAAPGNSVRLAYFLRPDLVTFLAGTLIGPFATVAVSTLYWPLGPIIVVVLPALMAYRMEQGQLQNGRRFLILIALFASILIAACFATTFYATAIRPPDRAWTVPQFIALSSQAAWGYVLGMSVPRCVHFKRLAYLQYAAVGLLVLIIIASIGNATVVVDKLKSYADAWDKLDRELRGSTGATVTLQVRPVPNVFGLEPLSVDQSFWVNTCMAQYYGVAGISASTVPDEQTR